jgi:hypothetical protein
MCKMREKLSVFRYNLTKRENILIAIFSELTVYLVVAKDVDPRTSKSKMQNF